VLRHCSGKDTRPVHGVSGIDHLGILDINWDKGFAKLGEPEPSISIFVIPVEEQFNLIL
jgi:hypothetical protein